MICQVPLGAVHLPLLADECGCGITEPLLVSARQGMAGQRDGIDTHRTACRRDLRFARLDLVVDQSHLLREVNHGVEVRRDGCHIGRQVGGIGERTFRKASLLVAAEHTDGGTEVTEFLRCSGHGLTDRRPLLTEEDDLGLDVADTAGTGERLVEHAAHLGTASVVPGE